MVLTGYELLHSVSGTLFVKQVLLYAIPNLVNDIRSSSITISDVEHNVDMALNEHQ